MVCAFAFALFGVLFGIIASRCRYRESTLGR